MFCVTAANEHAIII